MLKTVLITGSKGQLGCELIKLSAHYSNFYFIFTDRSTLNVSIKKEVIRFLQKHSIDYIIHCAAYTQVDRAEEDKYLCYTVNCDAVKNLAKFCQKQVRILYISTDYVFNGTRDTPYTEDQATDPLSVYGKSKRDGEIALLNECPQSIIIRTSWLYSSFGNNFVKNIINLLKKQTNLNVSCDQIGTPTYAADLAQVIFDIISHLEKIDPSCHGIFHYSNEGSTTRFNFSKKIAKLLNIQTCNIYPIPKTECQIKALRPKYSVLDKTKIKKTFGLSIPNWSDSLEYCIYNLNRIIKLK